MNDLELIKNKIVKRSEASIYNPNIKVKKTFFQKIKDKLKNIKNWFFNLFKVKNNKL